MKKQLLRCPVEPEASVYALLLSKMSVMYCLPCAARDHFVLAVSVYWNKTQQRIVLMTANKDSVGYEGHIKALKEVSTKASCRGPLSNDTDTKAA